jgi:hypothetical protein
MLILYVILWIKAKNFQLPNSGKEHSALFFDVHHWSICPRHLLQTLPTICGSFHIVALQEQKGTNNSLN